jgi:hypothetical protein
MSDEPNWIAPRLDGAYRVVCAWCQKHLDGDANASQVSHGICSDCARSVLKEGTITLPEPMTDQELEELGGELGLSQWLDDGGRTP